jgi:hypothetical protein
MSDKGAKTRWKKGQSGNPRGRPLKGVTLPYAAREMMDQPLRCEVDGKVYVMSRLERTLLEIIKRSDEGDLACSRFLLEQMSRWDRAQAVAARPSHEIRLRMAAEERRQQKIAAEDEIAYERMKTKSRELWEEIRRKAEAESSDSSAPGDGRVDPSGLKKTGEE